MVNWKLASGLAGRLRSRLRLLRVRMAFEMGELEGRAKRLRRQVAQALAPIR